MVKNIFILFFLGFVFVVNFKEAFGAAVEEQGMTHSSSQVRRRAELIIPPDIYALSKSEGNLGEFFEHVEYHLPHVNEKEVPWYLTGEYRDYCQKLYAIFKDCPDLEKRKLVVGFSNIAADRIKRENLPLSSALTILRGFLQENPDTECSSSKRSSGVADTEITDEEGTNFPSSSSADEESTLDFELPEWIGGLELDIPPGPLGIHYRCFLEKLSEGNREKYLARIHYLLLERREGRGRAYLWTELYDTALNFSRTESDFQKAIDKTVRVRAFVAEAEDEVGIHGVEVGIHGAWSVARKFLYILNHPVEPVESLVDAIEKAPSSTRPALLHKYFMDSLERKVVFSK